MAVTADSVDVLKAWLNNGTQKVLVVVAKDSTRPTARLLHSPAMASMSGTTITMMVEGELDADNRANIVEVNEAELQRRELVALPKVAFEAAMMTTPG